jgi:hypothetical protein
MILDPGWSKVTVMDDHRQEKRHPRHLIFNLAFKLSLGLWVWRRLKTAS